MKISVFGAGYVGAVTSACLVDMGHDVILVDVIPEKVKAIQSGKAPIVEKGLQDLIQKGVETKKLQATHDVKSAIMETEVSLICVGTPSHADGSLNLNYIQAVSAEIGEVLKEKDTYHIVVNRSTVTPGTVEDVICIALEEHSGKKAGVDFGVGCNPEFLREGSAIADHYNPTQIVVGALDQQTGEKIMALYDGIEAPRTITDIKTAESVKYVSNTWRATKISFANEMGNILKAHGVDSHKVMDIFFEDTKINLSKYFLLPGFAFGGSCLPKDVRAIRTSGQKKSLETPLFDSLLKTNVEQIKHAFRLVQETNKTKILQLGLSFKPGTDDLRESPLVTLAHLILTNEMSLHIIDPCVFEALDIDGPNRKYIRENIPEIGGCLTDDVSMALNEAEVIVIGHGAPEFVEIVKQIGRDKHIIDLTRMKQVDFAEHKNYQGICW